jgi:hypothetical protein
VTRDRGAHVLHSARVPAGESVLQALDRVAKVKTRFGGRYVRGVDGVEEHGNRSWFYYVNGYLADRSAADYRLRKGDLAWWDYRSWRNPAQDPVVVGAGVGALSRNVNVVHVQRGGGEAAVMEPVGGPTAGGPVKFTFRGDPQRLLQTRPFRYRYEVGG